MPADLLKFIEPEKYFTKFFSEGVFPDGRALETFKPLSFKRGASDRGTIVGSAILKQSGVTVGCTVTASIAVVSDAPLLTAKLMAETKVSKKALREVTDILDCLLAKEKLTTRMDHRSTDERMEWKLTLNLKIMHVDGPLIDAVLSAIFAALSDVKLPKIIIDHSMEDESPIESSQVSVDPSQSQKLKMDTWPTASTFSIFTMENGKEVTLCDPTTDILSVIAKRVEIVVDSKGQILYMRTKGGEISVHGLQKIVSLATRRQKEVQTAMMSL